MYLNCYVASSYTFFCLWLIFCVFAVLCPLSLGAQSSQFCFWLFFNIVRNIFQIRCKIIWQAKFASNFTKQGELLPKNQRFSNPCLNFKVLALKLRIFKTRFVSKIKCLKLFLKKTISDILTSFPHFRRPHKISFSILFPSFGTHNQF